MAPFRIAAALVILGMMAGSAAGAELPDAIAANGETVVLQVHAEGAQIYECKAAQGNSGLSWQFREPIPAHVRWQALRGTDMGNRRKRHRRQGGWTSARRDRQGHSLAKARNHRPARQWPA
jgi:hypothetical protein